MEELAPEQVVCSPIHVGSGQVRCAHGILPVPAPATAHILREVPTYGGSVRGELCTPTGAALLKYFVNSFGPSPVMRVEKIGYGMGSKEFEAMNGVRALLGETEEAGDSVLELRCNLDDMTPEAVGFAQEQLLKAGVLEVYTTPVGMKKNRPGILLTCLCRPEDKEKALSTLFAHTSTLGVRESLCSRYTPVSYTHLFLRGMFRQNAHGKLCQIVSEGQQQKSGHHVEHSVHIGDLSGQVARGCLLYTSRCV